MRLVLVGGALHNTLDPVVPFEHQENYSALVVQKHKSAFLSVLPSPGYGHYDFTNEELFQALGLMVQQAGAQPVN